MTTRLQQYVTIVGLFSALHVVFIESTFCQKLIQQAGQSYTDHQGGQGKIATWRTHVSNNVGQLAPYIAWTIALNEKELGTWIIMSDNRGLSRMNWFSEEGLNYNQPPLFDEETFKRQFEALRMACMAYIKAHQIRLNILKHPLAHIFKV